MDKHEIMRIQRSLENVVSLKRGHARLSIAEVAERSGLNKSFLINFRRGTSEEATQVEALGKWLEAEGYMTTDQPTDLSVAKDVLAANLEQVLMVLRDPTSDSLKVFVEVAWLAKTLSEQLGVFIGHGPNND